MGQETAASAVLTAAHTHTFTDNSHPLVAAVIVVIELVVKMIVIVVAHGDF